MSGRRAALAFPIAVLCGCTCASSYRSDAGSIDAPADSPGTTTEAGSFPDAGPSDGGDWSAVADLVCGPLTDAACTIQHPDDAHPCDGRGGVVFDGKFCQAAAGEHCGGEPGAFASFVECAFACEPMYCNPETMGGVGSSLPTDMCFSREYLSVCTGLYASSAVPLDGCGALGPIGCSESYCAYDDPSDAETAVRIRAMTLLPFVEFVDCLHGGP